MIDWPTLIRRLKARKINIGRAVKVRRETVWRWEHRLAIPTGDNAVSLILLDDETEEQRSLRERFIA